MADKKLIALLVALILFVVIVIGQSLLAEGLANSVVKVKQNETANKVTKNKNIRDSEIYTVTVIPSTSKALHESGKVKPTEHYYKGGDKKSNQIDCGRATSFSDLVACESLNTQNSVDSSTAGIWKWTIISSMFSFFAFCAAIASVRLLWDSNSETKQSNVLQLQPWLNVARPEIVETDFKHIQLMTGEDDSFCFGIKFSITNVGKTPVTSICFDFTELKILIKTGRKHTFLEGDCSSHLKTLPINPTKEPEQFIIYTQFTGGELVEAGWFTEVEQFFSGDHSIDDIFFIINADIRFKDKFTITGKHRCINVIAKNKLRRSKSGKTNKTLRVGVERSDADCGRFDILDEEGGHDCRSD